MVSPISVGELVFWWRMENDKRFGLLASGILLKDGEHLREVGHLAVVWVVTLKSSRFIVEDWLSSSSSSKQSISCSIFYRRDKRFEYRCMADEVLLEFGLSFITASSVVFSSSTFAFALLMSRVSDLKLLRWSIADSRKSSCFSNWALHFWICLTSTDNFDCSSLSSCSWWSFSY